MTRSKFMGRTVQDGDLVKTDDGYLGIVSCSTRRAVFLGNGLEELLTVQQWLLLEQFPINVDSPQGCAPANFIGLSRTLFAGK